jgi:AcrR family transcriptional regulator
MSPRPYRLGRRQEAAEETRARIIAAARDLLSASGGVSGFTIDSVARQAGVARMTVYHQFGSKQGLLEALFDSLAAGGGMAQLADAFRRPDPLDALDAFVAVFGRFWASERLIHRRLHGLAAIDPEFEPVLRARQSRRREGLGVLVGRLLKRRGRPSARAVERAVDVLYALTSFEMFDTLAGDACSPEEVTPVVQRLARGALGAETG